MVVHYTYLQTKLLGRYFLTLKENVNLCLLYAASINTQFTFIKAFPMMVLDYYVGDQSFVLPICILWNVLAYQD